MCGIFGCVLKEGNAAPIIHTSLKRLEYRGYDSVGIATLNNKEIQIKKDQGKIDEVHQRLDLNNLEGNIGIGHTRWATHGAPLKINSHPHTDCKGDIVVVHNGIIENFLELKAELQNLGHTFVSKTDTEVMAHLIEETQKQNPKLTFEQTVLESLKRIEGSYAFAILSTQEPNKIICARNESPLVIGINNQGVFCASDVPAFLSVTNQAVMINNGELVILTAEG
jgi:glucosamine--fructose-6-phosphate aminotransferase (isomerizing)